MDLGMSQKLAIRRVVCIAVENNALSLYHVDLSLEFYCVAWWRLFAI